MRQLTSIVAVNRDGVIGCRNSLPWKIKSDMAFFKKMTSNNCVIMGRKTHDSLGRCLTDRYNIVLSNQLHLFADTSDCVLRYGIADALAEAESAPANFSEVFVIGGSMMYEQFDGIVDRYLITIVDKKILNADAFFDLKMLTSSEWDVTTRSEKKQQEGDEASYQIFEFTSRNLAHRQTLRRALVDDILVKRNKRPRPTRRERAKDDPAKTMVFGW